MLFKSIFVTSALALFSQLSYARMDLDSIYKKLPETMQKGKLQPVLQCTQFGGDYDAVCESSDGQSRKSQFKLTQVGCDTISFQHTWKDENGEVMLMSELNATGVLGYGASTAHTRGAMGEVGYWMQNNSIVRSRLAGTAIFQGTKIQIDNLSELKMSGNGSCDKGVTYTQEENFTIYNDNDEPTDNKSISKNICTLCPITP